MKHKVSTRNKAKTHEVRARIAELNGDYERAKTERELARRLREIAPNKKGTR